MQTTRTLALVGALVGAAAATAKAQEQALGDELRYAKLLVDGQARCFASARSPAYDDRLVAGQVVKVGERVGEFYEVVLPLGVTGYVHREFAAEPADGMVTASASDVSFRYRMRTSEAPAMILPGGTPLYYLGAEGDWWRVRNPGAPAYLAAGEVEVFDTPTPTLEASYAELEKLRKAEWRAAVADLAAARAAAALAAEQSAALDALVAKLAETTAQPVAQQQLEPLAEQVAALQQDLPAGSPIAARADVLAREIERQQLVARALEVASTPVPTADVTEAVLPKVVEDPLDGYDAVGWLRRETSMRAPTRYILEKGGRLLFEITCTNGRYDLAMFEDCELGVHGSKSRPASDAVRQLDASRMIVLSTRL